MQRIAKWLFVNCILVVLTLWSVQTAWSDDGISAFETLTKLGSGSRINSLMYFSAPQQGSERVDNMALLSGKQPKKESKESLEGRFMLHEGSFGSEKAKLSFAYQDISSGFSGFQALRDAKVAPAEVLNQLEREKGLRRTSMLLNLAPGNDSALAIQSLSIGDDRGSISRRALSFTGRSAKFYVMTQDIDKGFGRIGSLSDVEKREFGNEVGMRRMNFGGGFKAGSVQTDFASSKVTDGDASISRRSLSFAGKSFNVKANFTDIDQNFARLRDLADPDRAALEQDRGYKRTDLTGAFKFGQRIALDAFYLSAKNAVEQRNRNQLRTNLVYTAANGGKFVWFRDSYSFNGAKGNISSYTRQIFAAERKFGKLAFVSVNRDTCNRTDLDGSPITAVVSRYHLESDKAPRARLVYDYVGQDFGTGRFENITDYSVGYKAAARLSFKSVFHAVDRGDDPSEATRTHSICWEVEKGLNLAADLTDRTTNNHNDGSVTRLSLMGPVADKLGPFSSAKIAAQYYSEDKNGDLQGGGESLKFEANVFKGSFVAEYAGVLSSPTSHAGARGFAFVSDRDPKKPYHFNLAYKSREIAPGKQVPVRNYGLDAKLSRKTSLVYSYRSYNERPDGVLEPLGVEELRMTSALGKDLNFVGGFRKQQDYSTRIGSYLMDVGLSGKLSNGAAFELGFGVNQSMAPTAVRCGRTYRIKYDHQVSADDFLAFEAQVTKWSGQLQPGQFATDILARIDFKRTFSL